MGRVKSFARNKEMILSSAKQPNGYTMVCLHKNKCHKNHTVHKLVAQSFIDKDYVEKKLTCDHINHIRDDNRLENLRVVTYRENNSNRKGSGTSIFTGVCFYKRVGKYIAFINIKGVNKYLGYFDCELEASKYYQDALSCVNENRLCDIKVKERSKVSKGKGVSFNKRYGKYVAYKYINGKNKNLGSFKTEVEAKQAYDDFVKGLI